MENKNHTNSNVKHLRDFHGIAQSKMASDLKIDQSTLAKWENGTRQITLEWALKLADYFDLDVGTFITKDLKHDCSPKDSKSDEDYKQFLKSSELMDENENIDKDSLEKSIKIDLKKSEFMKNNFANNLKYLRIKSDMTQVELAKKLNKDYSTIGKWELGQRCPIMTDVIKIAKLFNVSVDDLIIENLISKNETNNPLKTNEYDEFEILFNKNKKILSNSDKEIIKAIIEQRKKENKKD